MLGRETKFIYFEVVPPSRSTNTSSLANFTLLLSRPFCLTSSALTDSPRHIIFNKAHLSGFLLAPIRLHPETRRSRLMFYLISFFPSLPSFALLYDLDFNTLRHNQKEFLCLGIYVLLRKFLVLVRRCFLLRQRNISLCSLEAIISTTEGTTPWLTTENASQGSVMKS